MRKISYLTLVVFLFLQSCNDGVGSNNLHGQVMEYHDKMMPEMSVLYKAEQSLKDQISTADSGDLAVFNEKLTTVKQAQSSMMAWMREFSIDYKLLKEENEKVKFLKKELIKVKELDKEFDKALEIAKDL